MTCRAIALPEPEWRCFSSDAIRLESLNQGLRKVLRGRVPCGAECIVANPEAIHLSEKSPNHRVKWIGGWVVVMRF